MQRLDALGETLAKTRSEAISARHQLGIDQQWIEDLEFYEGIDDANRGEVGSWNTKPPGQAIAPVAKTGEARSTVFVNITRPYVDAAAARIGDMLMPTDDRSFSVDATPVAELADLAQGKVSVEVRKGILQQFPSADQKDQAISAVQSMVAKAQADQQEAKDRAKKAQTRIDDWFVECQYHAEGRKVIDDAAKLGTGVLKGPFPVKRRSQKVITENGEMKLVMQEKIAPASRRIDPFNVFPDPACGENIHNGSYIWERDFLSKKKLRELKRSPGGYIASQIEKCLLDGPQPATSEAPEPQGINTVDVKGLFEVWYYHGVIEREDLEAAGCNCGDDQDKTVFDAVLTMVNNRVIKAALNHLDTGEFPYDVMVWQRQAGRWTGIGVARQIRTPQRMVNAATRNMLDNAGLSAGPQIVMRLGVVTPADGNPNITPRKLWYVTAEAEINDLNGVFRTYNIESKQEELMAIIEFGLKLAEDVTGLPLLLQGQQGKAPDTLGGMQMLNNNSSTVLRRLAKLHDDGITEPHVRRYYVWLMQYGDDAEKGDFQIDARGSSALVERDIQNQAIGQMANIVKDPDFGVDPKKWFKEWCRSMRLDPKSFQYTEEEQKRIDEARAQQPVDPRVAVAQLRAQFEEKMQQLDQQFEAHENQLDRQLDVYLKKMEHDGKRILTLDDLKAALAQTAMKLRAQRDLSAASNAVTLHKNAVAPPTEPAGRAPVGQSFQR